MSAFLKASWIGATLLLLMAFGWRYHGMNAVVMADEWYYSSLTRLTPPADSSIPSYLYNAIYRTTTACGAGFLDCVRWLNAVFFLAAAPFIYLVGRRLLSARLASLVALLAMLGPVNSYTAYFMPESFYFFTFWITTWVAFRFTDHPSAIRATALGICVGALALIKLHALFLIPSLCLFILYSALRGKRWSHGSGWSQAIAFCVVMLVVALGVRLGFGYLVAGQNGLSLAGTLYAAQAGNSSGLSVPVLQLMQLSLFNLRGHISALTILFGVPIAAMAAHAVQVRAGDTDVSRRSPLAVYTILMLVALLGMTVAFTAFVAGNGQETNFRLHMRYYNFALPLLVIFGAAQIGKPRNLSKWFAATVGVALAAIIVFTIATTWHPFTPSMVDSPEFRGMSARRAAFVILSAISLLGVLAWIRKGDAGARIFLYIFMPLCVVASSLNIHHEVERGGKTNPFDEAGIAARKFLTETQLEKLVIVGTDVSGMFRARFHIDNAVTLQQTAPQKIPLDLKSIPADTGWILFMGDYPLPENANILAHGTGYSLVQLPASFPPKSAPQ